MLQRNLGLARPLNQTPMTEVKPMEETPSAIDRSPMEQPGVTDEDDIEQFGVPLDQQTGGNHGSRRLKYPDQVLH